MIHCQRGIYSDIEDRYQSVDIIYVPNLAKLLIEARLQASNVSDKYEQF
jgi:hypothetical protein